MKELPYFELRAALFSREKDQTVSFKLKELEAIWFCTTKNSKRKLVQYANEGRFQYEPGIGRGNPSVLRFCRPLRKEIEEAAAELARKDRLEEIIQLLQLPIPSVWVTNGSDAAKRLFGLQRQSASEDVLRTVIKRKLTTLQPMHSSITLESHLTKQLGDTLVVYSTADDMIKPHLAHHWQHDEDYSVWTFYLRKGVLFHDGKQLTSRDVAATFSHYMKTGTPNDWLVADIREIEILNPYLLRFHLHSSNPLFLRYVSSCNLAILPEDQEFDEYRWIGTGPFRLVERTETKLVLEAFDQYFLERPFLDRLEFWSVPEDAFEAVTYGLDREMTEREPQQLRQTEAGFRFLAFNFNRDPHGLIKKKSFRTALYHLLDTKKMWQELGQEGFMEASSFFPWKSASQVRDAAAIAPSLERAGYAGEVLTLYSLCYPAALKEARWFVKEAQRYGLKLELKTFSINELYSPLLDQQADLVFLGEVASDDHQLSFIGAFYNKTLLFRRFLPHEQLRSIFRLLDELKRQQTAKEREKFITRIETRLREEHLILFQHHPVRLATFHPMLRDVSPDAFNSINFRKLWIG